MQFVNVWGPAILVCLTVVLGLFFQNKRIDDLNRRIDDLRDSLGKRITDLDAHLSALFKSEIARLEKRIDSLESPLVRH